MVRPRETRAQHQKIRERAALSPSGQVCKSQGCSRPWVSLRQIGPPRERRGDWRKRSRERCDGGGSFYGSVAVFAALAFSLGNSNEWRRRRERTRVRGKDNATCCVARSTISAVTIRRDSRLESESTRLLANSTGIRSGLCIFLFQANSRATTVADPSDLP